MQHMQIYARYDVPAIYMHNMQNMPIHAKYAKYAKYALSTPPGPQLPTRAQCIFFKFFSYIDKICIFFMQDQCRFIFFKVGAYE